VINEEMTIASTAASKITHLHKGISGPFPTDALKRNYSFSNNKLVIADDKQNPTTGISTGGGNVLGFGPSTGNNQRNKI
jgi:hypothetical protein